MGGQVECVWTKEGSVNFVSDLEQGLNSVHASLTNILINVIKRLFS